MKKIFFLLAAFSAFSMAFASSTIEPTPNPKSLKASELFLPVGKSGNSISLYDLASIKVKDVELLTGKKMNLIKRLSFKVAQKKLQNSINPDGTINNKKITAQAKRIFGEWSFHLGGFLLGLFLGPIGVLICYFINDDYKRDRVNSSWRGFLAALLLSLAILGAAGGI